MTETDLPRLTPPFLGSLRPMSSKDAEKLAEACRDPETVKWTTVPPAYTLEMARAFIANDACKWAMTNTRDEFCGVIELRPHSEHTASVGYQTAPWARGKGVTTEALGEVTRWAFSQGFHRVELRADVDNAASRRVAEKAGFRLEGIARGRQYLHGQFRDLAVYSRLATD